MYTYAFFKTPAAPLELSKGIRGLVQIVSCGDLSALVEPELSLETLKDRDDHLMQAVLIHDRAIRDLFDQTTILPLRFGTCFVSLEGLQAHLSEHQGEYLEKLARFAGKAEYVLKWIPVAQPAEPEKTAIDPNVQGREYFLAKKQRYQTQLTQQQQQAAEIQAVMRTIAQTYADIVPGETQGKEERLYLLINRQEESLLLQNFQSWQRQCPHWEMQLEAALPPYHFL
ncbi:MAG TPA: gas vesicle protein [Cyanobacteria bacterium UBA11049]|nr:gas vesicle protein [Cyanobacteria bacterium UBA11049]